MASDIAVSGNSKPFWNYIKSKCNGTNTLVSLKVGDKELIENDSIASPGGVLPNMGYALQKRAH